tara:strand:+ start:51 stop:596 length:546 start_codon:yes stop_codon:yes gene_type:complete
MVKSIIVNKDGSISKDGKTYKSRGEYAKAMKEKRSKPIAKKSNIVKSDETGTFIWERTGTRMGKKKKYLTNFSDIKARAKEKMTSNKAYSASTFKEAFDQATKGDKLKFRWKNKDYLTTKGKRADRFPVTTDKKKAAVVGKDQRQLVKRVKWMEKRKKEGKSYSAKNLSELTKKLEELNIR